MLLQMQVKRLAVGEDRLTRSRGVRERGPAELGEHTQAVRALDLVDVDHPIAVEDDEVRGLRSRLLDPLEVRASGSPQG